MGDAREERRLSSRKVNVGMFHIYAKSRGFRFNNPVVKPEYPCCANE